MKSIAATTHLVVAFLAGLSPAAPANGEFRQNNFLCRDFAPRSTLSEVRDAAATTDDAMQPPRARTVSVSADAGVAAGALPPPALTSLTIVSLRPLWMWPPNPAPWALAPGTPTVSWTWQPEPEPEPSNTSRIAYVPPVTVQLWLEGMSRTTFAAPAPSWSRIAAPDFRVPTGRSRFAGERYLEPPKQFVFWSDRIETVLSDSGQFDRRCRDIGARARLGTLIRGCARRIADRCLITRIDDPGVARHELAHCNGWNHPTL
jgi:hypothetical protein